MSNVQRMIEDDKARNAAGDKQSPTYESGTPGGEPLSLLERQHPAVQAIIEAERDEFRKAMAATDAKLQAKESLRLELADRVIEKASLERHPRPDERMIARVDGKIAKIKERMAALDKKYEDEAQRERQHHQ